MPNPNCGKYTSPQPCSTGRTAVHCLTDMQSNRHILLSSPPAARHSELQTQGKLCQCHQRCCRKSPTQAVALPHIEDMFTSQHARHCEMRRWSLLLLTTPQNSADSLRGPYSLASQPCQSPGHDDMTLRFPTLPTPPKGRDSMGFRMPYAMPCAVRST